MKFRLSQRYFSLAVDWFLVDSKQCREGNDMTPPFSVFLIHVNKVNNVSKR